MTRIPEPQKLITLSPLGPQGWYRAKYRQTGFSSMVWLEATGGVRVRCSSMSRGCSVVELVGESVASTSRPSSWP